MSIHDQNRRSFLRKSLLALPSLSIGEGATARPIVETRDGKVQGDTVEGINVFKGIPYGGDTSGKNRFMAPTKPAPWKGVRDATQWGHVAPQRVGKPTDYSKMVAWQNQPGGQSEDCLVLNVWTPGIKDGHRRPVLFSIHGGGFATGTSGNPAFDGTPLAKFGDVVVVTINHRLGPLGYLHLGDVDPEFGQSGVAGMLDCVAALRWVRDNIANFGGDPGNVMIFGQSGGGAKVCTLMAMPSAKGLFHRAAMQSGVALRLATREAASENAGKLMGQLGLQKSQIRQLQQMSAQQIIDATGGPFGPVVDGTSIPTNPFDPTAPSISADIPVILSTCLQDNALSITNFAMDEEEMKKQAKKLFGADADQIVNAYRAADPRSSACLLLARMTTDKGLRRNVVTVAERKAAQGRAPVYMYLLAWSSAAYDGKFGAVHGTDVPLVFHNVNAWPITGTNSEARALADQMAGAWVAFARTGNPNTPGVPEWPAYTANRRATMVFDRNSRVESDPDGNLRRLFKQT